MEKQLVLASNSPRRRELLAIAGYKYEVIPSNASEIECGMSASEIVRLNAIAKAKEVADRYPDAVVIGADTVVCLDGKILGKPRDSVHAKLMLESLSGREHSVITGFSVVSGNNTESGVCETSVKFRKLSEPEIEAYIATGEPLDKAGAYGIQERASVFAESISGDYFNIVGLPVAELYPILADFGIFPQWFYGQNS